jgi:lipoate synthase
MSQFQPPSNMPDQINRSISQGEYDAALAKAEELGFEHAYVQPYPFTPEDHLAPDFVQEDPFRWDEKQ